MFSNLNKGKWATRIPEDTPYLKLSSCAPGTLFRAWGFYLNTKGKFENHYNCLVQGVTGGPFSVLNLPSYMNDTVEQLIADDNMVMAVNKGMCGLRTEDYLDKNKKRQIAVSWVDLEAVNDTD